MLKTSEESGLRESHEFYRVSLWGSTFVRLSLPIDSQDTESRMVMVAHRVQFRRAGRIAIDSARYRRWPCGGAVS